MAILSVRGHRLETTPVFDTYWLFAAERQAIYTSRMAGATKPWTDDSVLLRHRFTNVFRAADRVSQFLIGNVTYDGTEREHHDVVFRTLLFKLFNKTTTWANLERAVGTISWRDFDRGEYGAVLDELSVRAPIYSAAYVIPPPRLGAKRKHDNHLRLLELMMDDGLPDRLSDAHSLAEVFRLLSRYPSVGPFLAFQFAIDLNYTPAINFDEDDFVVAGPGAIDGIRKCFGIDSIGYEADIIRYMVDSQEEHFGSRGVRFDGLYGRRLHLIDAQNLFCEVDKYARVVHPEYLGRSGRSRIKQLFRPVAEPLSAHFPPEWGLRTESHGPRVEIDADAPLTLFA